jgi:hypothetical protein
MYLLKPDGNTHQTLRNVLVELYAQILEYQARVICHLSSAQRERAWETINRADDWEGKRTEIEKASKNCEPYIDAFKTSKAQEHFDRQWQQIEESVTIQKGILQVLDEIRKETKWNYEDEMERKLLQDLVSDYEGESDYEADKNFNPVKIEGTCEWFFTDDKFRHWRDSNASNLLWLSAGPGCGKSVLSRSLIDEGRLSTRIMTSTVCYFFFKAGTPIARMVLMHSVQYFTSCLVNIPTGV